jgi:ATP-binding cassette, subfamily B, bacterial
VSPVTAAGTYRRVLGETRPYWLHIGGLFLLSALGSGLTLLVPVPLKIAVDSVLGSSPVPGFLESVLPASFTATDSALLLTTAVLSLTITVVIQMMEVSLLIVSTYTGQRLVLAFRSRLFRHLERLSLTYHDLRGTTDSTYRIQWDAPAIQYIAVDGFVPLVTAGMTVIGMIAVTVAIDWQLALVAVTVTPMMIWLLRFYGTRLRRQWHEAKTLESSAFSVVQEALGALRVVKAFGREEAEKERFTARSAESVRAQIRLSLTEARLTDLVGITMGVGTSLVLYIGVRRVQDGALTLGELLLVMTYLTQLYEPLRTIAKKIGDLQASVASAQRAFSVLDQQPDVAERPEAVTLTRARGEVEFRHISFAYDGRGDALHDVSLKVDAGTSVGVAGTTGAGKTTLINLLTRFYDPTSGEILLDGVDLRDYRLADLRNQFAIVLQEPVLFSNTIEENIAYARPGADRSDVMAAAKAANAHDFITALPGGYDTTVGERGVRLSGGERQRVALARAFLKDAPILILDEPTSSVDVKTEEAIIDAMERLMSGRTSFMIAHRLTTLDGCDVRVALEEGRVATLTSVKSAASPACDVIPLADWAARHS